MTDVLPYNENAERAVIGACLVNERALDDVAEILQPSHFYLRTLGRLYQTMLELRATGTPIDPLLVHDHLTDPDLRQLVHTLAAEVTATSNSPHHAAVVRDTDTRRRLIQAGQEIARLGWEPPAGTDDAIDRAEHTLAHISLERDPGQLRHISETLDETYETLDKPGGLVTGTPTGIHGLDRITSGLQPGQLVVIAARPGMGKSALLITTVHYNTIRQQRPCAVFSIEMSHQEINQRLLAQTAGVDLMKIRTRNGLTPSERHNLDRSRPILEHAPIYTDDSANLRLADIRARARRLHRQHPDLALVAVDYLQLMITEQADNRTQEIAHLSRGLKVLARELQLPVIALAQLNRNLEYRHDKRPVLSDLRDSGAIEQDADLVLFLYRDDYYNPTTDKPGITELLLAKHRNGPTGMVEAAWIKDRATFSNLAQETAP